MSRDRLISVFVALLAGSVCACAESQSPFDQQLVVDSFVRAYNDHRVADALALLAPKLSDSSGRAARVLRGDQGMAAVRVEAS